MSTSPVDGDMRVSGLSVGKHTAVMRTKCILTCARVIEIETMGEVRPGMKYSPHPSNQTKLQGNLVNFAACI